MYSQELNHRAPEVAYFHWQPGLEVSPTISSKKQELISEEPYMSESKPNESPTSERDESLHYVPPQRRRSSLLGLSDLVRGLLLGAFVATIIMSVSLGVALGTRLVASQAELSSIKADLNRSSPCSPALSQPTNSTNSTRSASPPVSDLLQLFRAPGPFSIDTIPSDCSSNSFMFSIQNERYRTDCGRDYSNGLPTAEGGPLADIVGITAYSFGDCLNACSGFNSFATLWKFPTMCRSVSFATNMRNSTLQDKANCWLKNGTLQNPTKAFGNGRVMSAQLAP